MAIYMEEGAWTAEDEESGTGIYVVIGIFDDEDSFNLSPAYGPFGDWEEASVYGTSNFQFSWVCEIVNVDTASKPGHVHPDQSTISDYIDPSIIP